MKDNKLILTGYRHPSVGIYTPKVNKMKQLGLLGLAAACFATPFSNWLLPVTAKLITKFNPLWIYR